MYIAISLSSRIQCQWQVETNMQETIANYGRMKEIISGHQYKVQKQDGAKTSGTRE